MGESGGPQHSPRAHIVQKNITVEVEPEGVLDPSSAGVFTIVVRIDNGCAGADKAGRREEGEKGFSASCRATCRGVPCPCSYPPKVEP